MTPIKNMPPVTDDAAVDTAVAQQQESSFTRSMRELAEALKQQALSNPSVDRPLSTAKEQKSGPKVIIHLVRHAEADHNLAHLYGKDRATYKDPVLTQRGFNQCQRLLTAFPHMDDITLVLCSPLRRCMQTALFSFKPVYARGVKCMLWPALREWGNGASNIGYPVEEMEKEMASLPVDLRLLNEGWELEQDLESDGAQRSNVVRRDLYALANTLLVGGVWKGSPLEKHSAPIHILVVSHGGFLSNVMRVFADGSCLHNAEYKSFSFASEEQIGRGVSKHRLFELSKSAKAAKAYS